MKMQRKETEEYRRERAERQSRKAHSTHEHENEVGKHQLTSLSFFQMTLFLRPS